MRLSSTLLIGASLFATAATCSPQNDQAAQGPQGATVKIGEERKFAELQYRFYLAAQHQLSSYVPAEPRLIDMWYRVVHNGVTETERDSLAPNQRMVMIQSEHVKLGVPTRRGTYFTLPEVQEAYDEDAELVISGAYQAWLAVWWTLRVPAGQQVSYADIRQARGQITGVQNKISAYAHPYFRNVKRKRYDAIKACYRDESGNILLNGRPAANATQGLCKVLFIGDGRGADDDVVAFTGPLDVVTFVDTRYYR